jgi:outer membrane protein assembly factor BamB
VALGLQAGDWPQFRGPGRDGVWNETDVTRTFPPEGLKVLWRAPTGAGLSSPVVSGGHVFLCDSELKKPQAWERVHCYDEKTGKELWTYKVEVTYPDWAFDPKSEAGPDATPLVSGGRLFAFGRMGMVHCLDARDGSVIWQKDLGKQYGSESIGTTPSPLLEGSLLILVTGGKPDACVISLDKDSGTPVWHALDDKWTYSTPLVISAGGKRQFILSVCSPKNPMVILSLLTRSPGSWTGRRTRSPIAAPARWCRFFGMATPFCFSRMRAT